MVLGFAEMLDGSDDFACAEKETLFLRSDARGVPGEVGPVRFSQLKVMSDRKRGYRS